MKIKTFVIGYAFALAIFLFAQHRTTPESSTRYVVVDLTHTLTTTLVAPDAGKNALRRPNADLRTDSQNLFGTHIDAPAHFAPGLWTVDQIPAERLIAPYALLDVRRKTASNPDYQISVADIADWEHLHGHIPQGAVVIARTGWESRWNSQRDYRNADLSGTMHFPGYSTEAARFLIEGRNIIGLGIDTPGVDSGESVTFPARKFTLSHSVYQLENVANLSQLPESGGTLVVAPAKVVNGTTAPVRLLAMAR